MTCFFYQSVSKRSDVNNILLLADIEPISIWDEQSPCRSNSTGQTRIAMCVDDTVRILMLFLSHQSLDFKGTK